MTSHIASKIGLLPAGVNLPMRMSRAESGSGSTNPAQSRQSSAGIVMLIDDDEALLEVMAGVLRLYHVKVKSFINPESAVAWHRDNDGAVDLAFLDMCNPAMDGEECYPALMRNDDQLPVILMSGGLEMSKVTRLLSDGAMCFLQKPFNCLIMAEGVVRWLESSGRYVGPEK